MVGFKYVVIGYGVCHFKEVILFFLIDSPVKVSAEDKAKNPDSNITLKDFGVVLKNPGTWFTGIAIFKVIYTFYVSLSYFTPYFTGVLGVSATFAGAVAIVRTYVIRTVGAPLGGMLEVLQQAV